MPNSGITFATLLVAVFIATGAAPVLATSESGREDLATKLNKVASAANVEILFAPEVVAEKQPGPVTTTGGAGAVLDRLLAGTGLTARQTSPDVFVITESTANARASATTASLASGQTGSEPPQSAQEPAPTTETGVGAVEGRIVEETSGAGLAGATVRLEGTTIDAVTDQRGYYRLGAVPAGDYEVTVEYIGAQPLRGSVQVRPNRDAVADFSLHAAGPETIYVYGSRSSYLQALNQQRSAENNKTVVSADLLGTFPAETVAEALRRVPGVTFVRDETTGEANKVSVRGITSEGINIQLNGMQLQGTGIERAVDLTGFLADNVSQITIQKSLLPEYEGTGNGGLIEIETKSALDYGDRYLGFGVEREFSPASEFGDETQYNLSAVTSLGDTFAVGIIGQYRSSDRRNYDVGYSHVLPPVLPDGYTSTFLMPFTFNFPFEPEFDDRLVTNANYRIRDREVDNWTGSVFAAWDIGDATRLRAEVQRINNEEITDARRSTNQTLTGALTMPIPELGGVDRRRTYVRALRPTVSVNNVDEVTETDVFSLRGESFLNRWTINYSAGMSRSRKKTLAYGVSTLSDQNTDILNLIDAGAYTLNPDTDGVDRIVDGAFRIVGDQVPTLALSDAGFDYYSNPNTYYITSTVESRQTNETENLALALDARYDIAGEWLSNVKFGIKFNDIERSNSDDVLSNATIPARTSFVRTGTTRQVLPEFGGDTLQLLDLGSIGASGTRAAFIRGGSARSIFQQIAAFEQANPGSYNVTDNSVSTDESHTAISAATTIEEILAAFVQSEVALGDVTVTGGVRVEFGDYTGTAVSIPRIRLDTGEFIEQGVLADAGLVVPFDNSGSTEKFLPSLVATWRPNDSWVGRLAYNRTIFSPSLQAINRGQLVLADLRPTQNSATIREGNPNLDATVNDNYEVGLDYYFEGRPAYLKGAVFYKDIENNITNVSLADLPADVEQRVRDYLAPLQATFPDLLDGLNADTEYLLQRPENGDGGSIYGVELEGAINLDFLPDSWPGFLENIQLLGNVTWTDAEFPTLVSARDENGDPIQIELDRPLEEQSEWAGNASIGYQAGGFSGRLLYTYQSERVRVYDEFNLNLVVPEIETLDLIATYTMELGDSRYTFFLEGDNLLEGAHDAIVQNGIGSYGGEGSPDFFFPGTLLFDGGRTFTVGVKAAF